MLLGSSSPGRRGVRLFNVSLIAIRNDEGMYDDLALDLHNPISDILNVGRKKELPIQSAGNEIATKEKHPTMFCKSEFWDLHPARRPKEAELLPMQKRRDHGE